MNTKYDELDKLLVLEITEEIDHHWAEKIRRKADYEIERFMPKRIIFDFSKVSFMDSAGIGMLLGRYKTARMLGGEIEIKNVKPSIKKILDMSGISKVIPICEEEIA